jgi:hypothetical protein
VPIRGNNAVANSGAVCSKATDALGNAGSDALGCILTYIARGIATTAEEGAVHPRPLEGLKRQGAIPASFASPYIEGSETAKRSPSMAIGIAAGLLQIAAAAMCSFNRMPASVLRNSRASAGLRSRNGQLRISSPSYSTRSKA